MTAEAPEGTSTPPQARAMPTPMTMVAAMPAAPQPSAEAMRMATSRRSQPSPAGMRSFQPRSISWS